MSRYSRGTTCPQCKQHAGIKTDGTMAEHRTELLVWGQKTGGRRLQRCGYAGVTPDEARAGITNRRKRVEAYRAKQATP